MSIFGKSKNKRYLPIDYHQKKLENPFFKGKDKIILLTGLKAKIIIVAVVLFLVFIFWFLYLSSFWTIKEVSATGLDQITNDEIRNLVAEQISAKNFNFLPQKNLLFFREEKFRETLKKKYRFQKVVIQKKWPNKLFIKITEKPLACVWIENEKYFYADIDGYVVQEINPLDLKDKKYPLISNESGKKISNSKIQTDPAYLLIVPQLYEKVAASMPEIIIDRFIIDDEIDTIKIQTPEGLKISFDIKGDLDKQVDRLYILKTQKLKDDFAGKKKIDLRFGDKIYYQ